MTFKHPLLCLKCYFLIILPLRFLFFFEVKLEDFPDYSLVPFLLHSTPTNKLEYESSCPRTHTYHTGLPFVFYRSSSLWSTKCLKRKTVAHTYVQTRTHMFKDVDMLSWPQCLLCSKGSLKNLKMNVIPGGHRGICRTKGSHHPWSPWETEAHWWHADENIIKGLFAKNG